MPWHLQAGNKSGPATQRAVLCAGATLGLAVLWLAGASPAWGQETTRTAAGPTVGATKVTMMRPLLGTQGTNARTYVPGYDPPHPGAPAAPQYDLNRGIIRPPARPALQAQARKPGIYNPYAGLIDNRNELPWRRVGASPRGPRAVVLSEYPYRELVEADLPPQPSTFGQYRVTYGYQPVFWGGGWVDGQWYNPGYYAAYPTGWPIPVYSGAYYGAVPGTAAAYQTYFPFYPAWRPPHHRGSGPRLGNHDHDHGQGHERNRGSGLRVRVHF